MDIWKNLSWKNLSKKGKIASIVAVLFIGFIACNWIGWI